MSLPVALRWFERRTVAPGLTLLWEPHVDPFLRCNIWHLRGRDRDLLVDSGLGVSSLASAARDLFAAPLLAVATHAHLDHIGGLHEFDCRLVHAAEAATLEQPPAWGGLLREQFPSALAASLERAGYPLPPLLIDALPYAGFEPAAFQPATTRATGLLADGDLLDLGDRAFEVLHLPGHSPGSIGLWEAASGTLFSGDAVYDGPLLDDLPGADRLAYARTVARLKALPVQVVHGGHDPSFGRRRLHEILESWERAQDQKG